MNGPRSRVRIQFLGHSHARNLAEFIASKPERRHFGFDEAKVNIDVFGMGGLKLDDFVGFAPRFRPSRRGSEIFLRIDAFRPDFLVLLIGDNDVVENSLATLDFKFNQLIALIRRRFPSVRQVILSQLLPRYGLAGRLYNDKAGVVNQRLMTLSHNNDYVWIKICLFYFPQNDDRLFRAMARFFRRDGVHLTPAGHYKLYRALRAVVANCLMRFTGL